MLARINEFSYEREASTSEAIKVAGELFEQSNRVADEKALIIYITSNSVELMDKDELDMLQGYADNGMKIVFVVSGDLGQGSKESLLKIVEEPNRIIYLNADGKADGSVPTALLSEGNIIYFSMIL